MSAFQAARDLADEGVPVFPCKANKKPVSENGFKNATLNPFETWWRDAPLVGMPTGAASGYDVLDIDTGYKDGVYTAAADGRIWYEANKHRIPATRIHRTQRGGFHLYFNSHAGLRCSARKTGPMGGVDVRANGGFVIRWDCTGLAVEDAPIADWPAWLLSDLVTPASKAVTPGGDHSSLSAPSVGALVSLLDRMPNPITVGRDEWVRVMLATVGAMRGLDAAGLLGDGADEIGEAAVGWECRWEGGGVDHETAWQKWQKDWSIRATPIAGWPNLQAIASSLIPEYRYEVAAAEFGTVPDLAPAPVPAATPGNITARPFTWRDPRSIAPREWVYGGHYIRKFLSATVAPGGLGKSSLALVEALDMVTGRGLLTGKPSAQRYRVWYWNGEDPIEETERRVMAACLHFGITADDIGDRLFLNSGRDSPIKLATETRDGLQVATPVTESLIREVRNNSIDVLILDPFVKTHSVNENDNGKIDAVASQFAEIADKANISVELIHHLRKGSGQGIDRTADDARGAVSLVSAARSVRVLNPMQTSEAESLGIAEEARRSHFRVDDGKVNLMPPSDRAVWRKLVSVALGNERPGLAGDKVGVVSAWEKTTIEDSIPDGTAATVCKRLEGNAANRRDHRSPDWMGTWLATILGLDLNLPGAKKRIVKIIDLLISQEVLKIVAIPNGKGRTVDTIIAAPQSHSPDCGVTVGTVGKHTVPHTPTVVTVGCGVCGGEDQGKPQSDCGDCGGDTLASLVGAQA